MMNYDIKKEGSVQAVDTAQVTRSDLQREENIIAGATQLLSILSKCTLKSIGKEHI